MSADAADPLRETLVERHLVHGGRLLTIVDDDVRLEDGRMTHRETVLHPGAVCIIAIDADGRIALVRQWRHPVGRALWELPAGTRDHAGEGLEATAARELEEEVGAAAREWRLVGTWPLAPGYSSEVMHFFLATGISEKRGRVDPDEQLEVAWCTRDETLRRIRDAAVDVKTVAGLAIAGVAVTTDG